MSSGLDLLDASALLAVLGNEPGSDTIRDLVPGGMISAVNFAEVLKKLLDRGMPKATVLDALKSLNLEVLPFSSSEALHSADFIHPAISLAGRACLGTAQLYGYRVVTGESNWVPIRQEVPVYVFR